MGMKIERKRIFKCSESEGKPQTERGQEEEAEGKQVRKEKGGLQ